MSRMITYLDWSGKINLEESCVLHPGKICFGNGSGWLERLEKE